MKDDAKYIVRNRSGFYYAGVKLGRFGGYPCQVWSSSKREAKSLPLLQALELTDCTESYELTETENGEK